MRRSSARRSRATPSARSEQNGLLVLVLGVKDIEVADYHYQFYNALAGVVAERWPQDVQERFFRTIREELSAEIHGEWTKELAPETGAAAAADQRPQGNQALPRLRAPGVSKTP